MNLIPTVIEQTPQGERAFDIFSRILKDRIVFLDGEIDDRAAALIKAQLLYLEAEDPQADIWLYIDSPGGSVTAGMGIYDVMNFVTCDVGTICTGLAASMGAFLLSAGAKGKRFCLPNSEVMIHQPLGGAQGQATDVLIAAERMKKLKHRLTGLLADHCGKSFDEMAAMMERDHWMDAEEAVALGIVDGVKDARR